MSQWLARLREFGLLVTHSNCYQEKDTLSLAYYDRVRAIVNQPPPDNVTSLKCFLRVMDWFKQSITDFEELISPFSGPLKKNKTWNWNADHLKAFEQCKQQMVKPPILVEPDPCKKFIIHTDASDNGIGACLWQQGDHFEHRSVIAYASHAYSRNQKKLTKKEKNCFAIIFALEHFRSYIHGRECELQTDNQALIWLGNIENPSPLLARWRVKLQKFEFDVKCVTSNGIVVPIWLNQRPIRDLLSCSEE